MDNYFVVKYAIYLFYGKLFLTIDVLDQLFIDIRGQPVSCGVTHTSFNHYELTSF